MIRKIISSFITMIFMAGFVCRDFCYAQQENLSPIAVMDLNALGVSSSEAVFVTEFFRSALVNSESFMVIDRANMGKILAEQGFQQTGCTTQECAVKIGKILNVQKMINGNFGKLGETYQITINVIEVETGRIAYSDSASCEYSKDLKSTTDELADRMINKMLGKSVTKPLAPVTEMPSAPEMPMFKTYGAPYGPQPGQPLRAVSPAGVSAPDLASLSPAERDRWLEGYTMWEMEYNQTFLVAYPLAATIMVLGGIIAGGQLIRYASNKSASINPLSMIIGITLFVAGPAVGGISENKLDELKRQGKPKGYMDYYKKKKSAGHERRYERVA